MAAESGQTGQRIRGHDLRNRWTPRPSAIYLHLTEIIFRGTTAAEARSIRRLVKDLIVVQPGLPFKERAGNTAGRCEFFPGNLRNRAEKSSVLSLASLLATTVAQDDTIPLAYGNGAIRPGAPSPYRSRQRPSGPHQYQNVYTNRFVKA